MEDFNKSLEGAPAKCIQFKLLGTDMLFELPVSQRERASELKCELASVLSEAPNPNDIKLVYCGKVIFNHDVVLDVYDEKILSPVYIVLKKQVDCCLDTEEDVLSPTIDQKSLIHAMRWLMNEGNTPSASDRTTRSIEEVLQFYRSNSDLVINKNDLTGIASESDPAVAPPAVAVEPPLPAIPHPRWFDLSLLAQVVITTYIFTNDLYPPLRIAIGAMHYLLSSGILMFICRWMSRRYFGGNMENFNGLRNRFDATGIRNAAGNALMIPVQPGLIKDCYAFFGALCMSVYPSWRPQPALPAPPPEATPVRVEEEPQPEQQLVDQQPAAAVAGEVVVEG